jgi:hypothetical protein
MSVGSGEVSVLVVPTQEALLACGSTSSAAAEPVTFGSEQQLQ